MRENLLITRVQIDPENLPIGCEKSKPVLQEGAMPALLPFLKRSADPLAFLQRRTRNDVVHMLARYVSDFT